MTRQAKVPRVPPPALTRRDTDLLIIQPVLWRVHRTTGPNVRPWNSLRTFGPLPTARYDTHPEPIGLHPESGVTYTALDLATCLAETFQFTRTIDVQTGSPHATAWQPTRALRLLDLTDTWPIRNGSAAALTSATRQTCRNWARAIRATWPDLDGLCTHSTWTARPAIVLWQPAADTFPDQPLFSRPLGQPLIWSLVRQAASEIGFDLL